MSWPIPTFRKFDYPEPMSIRLWLPTLIAIASVSVAAVLLLWPHAQPTNTLLFRCTLIGAPLVACALVFGVRLDRWEDEQTDAEEMESEQHRLNDLWRDWTRRHLRIADVAAFPAAIEDIASIIDQKTDQPSNKDRSVPFEWGEGRAVSYRRTRILHLVARRFAGGLRAREQVFVTLMLNDASLTQIADWTKQAQRILRRTVPGVTFHVDARSATDGVQWITQQVDRIDLNTRLVIAAQLWPENQDEREFSEGVAAFLIEPSATKSGAIFRPMTSTRDTLSLGLSQIVQKQVSPDRVTRIWSAACHADDSSALRSVIKADPNDPVIEQQLDDLLGNPGPAGGWIALAIAMEATPGAGSQLVVWREPASESLYLCTIASLPQEERTV